MKAQVVLALTVLGAPFTFGYFCNYWEMSYQSNKTGKAWKIYACLEKSKLFGIAPHPTKTPVYRVEWLLLHTSIATGQFCFEYYHRPPHHDHLQCGCSHNSAGGCSTFEGVTLCFDDETSKWFI